MPMYSSGSNSHSQLSLDHAIDTHTPTPCLHSSSSSPSSSTSSFNLPSPPLSISCGSNHSALIDTQGHLWTTGNNSQSQLGHPNDAPTITSFHRVPFPPAVQRWKQVRCGWDGTFVVDECGDLWGLGDLGYLNLDNDGDSKGWEMRKLERGVCCLSVGVRHLGFVQEGGSVQGIGNGKWGGWMGQDGGYLMSRKVAAVQVACGQMHTIVLCEDGTVVGFGSNKRGQLGSAFSCSGDVIWPVPGLDVEGRVVQVEAGWSCSGVRLDSGLVVMWGRNDKGQLGGRSYRTEQAGNTARATFMHNKVEYNILGSRDNPIRDISLGAESGIAVYSDGVIRAWGWNEHGNLGVGVDSTTGVVEECVWEPRVVHLPHQRALWDSHGGGDVSSGMAYGRLDSRVRVEDIRIACGGGHSLFYVPPS
ncbi:hypothetical protein HDV05_004477 [Chytridiales sp. JEL 0842]|nr:hypothetical protein HDV05_004477 [Chytridiales sp. JEL 0842]